MSLRTFFMEDWLESYRSQSQFNLGESGHAARTVRDVIEGSDITLDEATNIFFEMSLSDSPNWGRTDLRARVAEIHPQAQVENVLITTGTSEALFLLLRQLKPSKVALIVPAFQLLYEVPLSLGAKLLPLKVDWTKEGIATANWDLWMQQLCDEKPDVVIWNHPHNPTGIVFTQTQLTQLQNICDQIDATLIGDEHYRFLTTPVSDANLFLGPTLYRNHPKTFVTGSFIKCTGTPGLRIGWCVGPKNVLTLMQNEKNYTTHTVNPLSEWLATLVLQNLNSTLWNALREEWSLNKTLVENFLSTQKNFIGFAPQGGLVCCIANQSKHSTTSFESCVQQLLTMGIFLLPLTSMEFSRWELNAPENFKNGFGFRLGLGNKPSDFKIALQTFESLK